MQTANHKQEVQSNVDIPSESGFFNGGIESNTSGIYKLQSINSSNSQKDRNSQSPRSRYKAYAKRMEKFRGDYSVGSGNSQKKSLNGKHYVSE